MSLLSERLAKLAERFHGSSDDGEMVIDHFGRSVIALALSDCADDAAILEQKNRSLTPQTIPAELKGETVIDFEQCRTALSVRKNTPGTAA